MMRPWHMPWAYLSLHFESCVCASKIYQSHDATHCSGLLFHVHIVPTTFQLSSIWLRSQSHGRCKNLIWYMFKNCLIYIHDNLYLFLYSFGNTFLLVQHMKFLSIEIMRKGIVFDNFVKRYKFLLLIFLFLVVNDKWATIIQELRWFGGYGLNFYWHTNPSSWFEGAAAACETQAVSYISGNIFKIFKLCWFFYSRMHLWAEWIITPHIWLLLKPTASTKLGSLQYFTYSKSFTTKNLNWFPFFSSFNQRLTVVCWFLTRGLSSVSTEKSPEQLGWEKLQPIFTYVNPFANNIHAFPVVEVIRFAAVCYTNSGFLGLKAHWP